jgi:hypothetical protein
MRQVAIVLETAREDMDILACETESKVNGMGNVEWVGYHVKKMRNEKFEKNFRR